MTEEAFQEFCDTHGLKIVGPGSSIRPGDLYVAGRNTGPHLLECRINDPRGWIVPTTTAYHYDYSDCAKVE